MRTTKIKEGISERTLRLEEDKQKLALLTLEFEIKKHESKNT